SGRRGVARLGCRRGDDGECRAASGSRRACRAAPPRGRGRRGLGGRRGAANRGTRIGASLRNGELVIEGVTHHPTAGGGTQLIVYFTPHVDAVSRRLWLHA